MVTSGRGPSRAASYRWLVHGPSRYSFTGWKSADADEAGACDAGVCRPARLDDRLAGSRGELRGGPARSPRESNGGRTSAGDRSGAGVAAGPLGPLGNDLLATLQELEHLGVGFVSLTEALDLTTPAGLAMAGRLAIFAEFEREVLRERTRAGLAHARENGRRLGRPMTAGLKASEIRNLHRAGVTKSEIARRLQIGRTSIRRTLERPYSSKR